MYLALVFSEQIQKCNFSQCHNHNVLLNNIYKMLSILTILNVNFLSIK